MPCHTGTNKIPKHSEYLIWLFYIHLHFKHPHLHHISPIICLFTHSSTQLENEQSGTKYEWFIFVFTPTKCLTSSDMVKWSIPEKSHNVCTAHIFTSILHKTKTHAHNLPCPGRKFTYSLYIIEKIQINISSVGSSLFFLLLSANTWLPVLLRHWWKTQMCSGACLWSRDHSILHLIHHLNCKKFSCDEQYRHIWSKEAVICLSDQISDPSSRYHESESYQRC